MYFNAKTAQALFVDETHMRLHFLVHARPTPKCQHCPSSSSGTPPVGVAGRSGANNNEREGGEIQDMDSGDSFVPIVRITSCSL
jgi:hypothetical protein